MRRPGVGLGEVALAAKPVHMIHRRPVALLQGERCHVIVGMAGGALGSGFRRMDRLDVLVDGLSVPRPSIDDEIRPLMA